MTKAMIFIDANWLYAARSAHAQEGAETSKQADFGRLTRHVMESLHRKGAGDAVDLARTYLFGSYPAEAPAEEGAAVPELRAFLEHLRKEIRGEARLIPCDPAAERGAGAVALTAMMMYYAAIPYAYDIAVVVTGDPLLTPALQNVRRLGKRVAIASMREACCRSFRDPYDPDRVRDFDVIWLDALTDRARPAPTLQSYECESPNHPADLPRNFTPAQRLRKSAPRLCDHCRPTQPQEAPKPRGESPQGELRHQPAEALNQGKSGVGASLTGHVTKLIVDRNTGFILSDDNRPFIFYRQNIPAPLELEQFTLGARVKFIIRSLPGNGKNGEASDLRLDESKAGSSAE